MDARIVKIAQAEHQDELGWIARLMLPSYDPERVLKVAQETLGQRDWIQAGLAALDGENPEDAAAIAVADFWTTLEVLHGND